MNWEQEFNDNFLGENKTICEQIPDSIKKFIAEKLKEQAEEIIDKISYAQDNDNLEQWKKLF
jgi:curved DNA-binding protein CbpA